jgi:hypothetical protein
MNGLAFDFVQNADIVSKIEPRGGATIYHLASSSSGGALP